MTETVVDDEAIAAALQREEDDRRERVQQTTRRNHNLLRRHRRHVVNEEQLKRDIRVLLLFIAVDICFSLVLLLQLGPGGFPNSEEEFHARWNGSLVHNNFWFVPIFLLLMCQLVAAVAACRQWRNILGMYCIVVLGLMILRLVFVYRAGAREGLEERSALLVDMILLSIAIFVEIAEFRCVTTIALCLNRVEVQKRVRARSSLVESGTMEDSDALSPIGGAPPVTPARTSASASFDPFSTGPSRSAGEVSSTRSMVWSIGPAASRAARQLRQISGNGRGASRRALVNEASCDGVSPCGGASGGASGGIELGR